MYYERKAKASKNTWNAMENVKMKSISYGKRENVVKRAAASLVLILMLFSILSPLIFVDASAASSEQINYFGTVVPCGKDNGYIPNTTSDWSPWTLLTTPGIIMGLIPDSDPHKGWSLGSFFVSGYSGMTESSLNVYGENMPVYLKNTGDTVSFGFKLDQNINKLNGNSSLKIADDHKVIQDCWVDDPYVQGDFHHGVLIVVHTDYQGNQKITTYRDFLKGKTLGANTQVDLFEEGDYRVILCYEVYKDTGWNWITDWMDPNGSWFAYRMESYFSVRNGNAMVFPFDLGNGAELTNRSYTETGFRVDLAKSRYLKLSVKKENLNAAGTEIIEDTRFNKVVADNSQFTDEGKYTVTVTNVYTNLTTEKIIYVGTNDIMRCNTVTGLSVATINSRLSSGYTINPDGTLKEPKKNNIVASGSSVESDVSDSSSQGFNWFDFDFSTVNVWKCVAIAAIALLAVLGIGMIIE